MQEDLIKNQSVLSGDYPQNLKTILNTEDFDEARKVISNWPHYHSTALFDLSGLAKELEVGKILYKDEATRFGLKSFKALGGAYAVEKLTMKLGSEITVTTATDGNHGRSVAWGANRVGAKAVIFVHSGVSDIRVTEIEKFGARVIKCPGNYDHAVQMAQKEAEKNRWHVISDTSYVGYEKIPRLVMSGYGVMVNEIFREVEDPPTHVFVQCGVGALAATVCASMWSLWGSQRPKLILVESVHADCFFQSIKNGYPTLVEGKLDTMIAGLACGQVSKLAWEIIKLGFHFFLRIEDQWAIKSMNTLAHGGHLGDPIIEAGESGGAGLAGLLKVNNETGRNYLKLSSDSRILIFGTEGVTDKKLYAKFTTNIGQY